jgi:hypothetical protein
MLSIVHISHNIFILWLLSSKKSWSYKYLDGILVDDARVKALLSDVIKCSLLTPQNSVDVLGSRLRAALAHSSRQLGGVLDQVMQTVRRKHDEGTTYARWLSG